MLCNPSFCQIQMRYVGIIFIFQYQVLTTFFPSLHRAVKRFYGVWDSKWPVSDTKYPELKSLVKKYAVRICSERALASSPGLHSPAVPSPHGVSSCRERWSFILHKRVCFVTGTLADTGRVTPISIRSS